MVPLATIPPTLPFVDALAAGLLAEVSELPALADVLVLLPTRRACRSLREAFVRRTEGRALLLPRIQPIGEVEADELLLAGAIDLALPPAISPLRRQLLLARLLAAVTARQEHALRLAGELALLLDELQTERVALDQLDRLVPDELAEHWQASRKVLGVIAEAWPAVLAEEGALDPAERRHRLLTSLAEHWRRGQPQQWIVAAGSTGSIPGTRALLQVVVRLPRGTVVLPGLDRELDDVTWQTLHAGHPQYGLKQLLDALEVERASVPDWPSSAVEGTPPARALLLREVMRPAATIGAWHEQTIALTATAGLHLGEFSDLAAEALALAVRMRGVLEQPGRTAALVTPDRHLARRVAAELRRWGIEVDDSAGTPLDQTPPGAFLLLSARLIVEGVEPVTLLATLKHPLASGGMSPAAFRRRVRELELACLRGPRIAGGFAGVIAELRRARLSEPQRTRLAAWVEDLQHSAYDFAEQAAGAETDLATLIRAHLAFAENLAHDAQGQPRALWSREAGEAAAALFAELLAFGPEPWPIVPTAYPALLAQLMAARTVRPRAPKHPRLSIWGELEARLQHTDLLLLGGLNEGSWPRTFDPGPWLNRTMRAQLGLPPVERRLGLAAHDFVQAACAPEVLLSRAEKDPHGNPTVPSRWLVRLQTLLEAQDAPAASAADPARAWSATLDAIQGVPRPIPPPEPRPPLAARPRRLSVSDIGAWMEDAYALYARRILRLAPLDPLDADPGALDRGIIIHRALERFVAQWPDALPDDALQHLLHAGVQQFAELAHRPQVYALWWPRFVQVARWVVAQEQARRPGLVALRPEVAGELELERPGGRFVVRARADRLEHHPDGSVTVVDYKTGGQLPARAKVAAGLAPQLPLEALMVEQGAFEGQAPAEVAALRFWHLKGDEKGGAEEKACGEAPADLAAAALVGLERLIDHYDQETTAYPPRPKPRVAPRRDYDHLSRLGEWSS
jgi:ATP-dependent helicase/nuclease subunit B